MPRCARLLALLCLASALACEQGAPPDFAQTCDEQSGSLRPEARPVEFTSFSVQNRTTAAAFETFADGLFGDAARAGDGHPRLALSPGFLLSVEEDPRTAEQLIIAIEATPPQTADSTEPRLVTKVPASFQLGGVWVEGVRAALARSDALQAEGETDLSPWNLDFRARSANGGALLVQVAMEADGGYWLRVENENPHTSLAPGQVNQPALAGTPYETVGGTVWFDIERDTFDFFASRAYGVSAGADQNFRDFKLLPHDWLRITVTPQYSIEMVDVAFEVVTTEGDRVNLARAPASYVAGEQFHNNVLRMLDDMSAAEAAEPGSSGRFRSVFDYEDPEGGGIVRVVVLGEGGRARVAYEVVSPAAFLEDVEFVPLLGTVELPEDVSPESACAEDERSDEGRFLVTFAASSTVANNPNLKAPLVGDIVGSVFRAEDVTITGPNDGAEAVASFQFEDVDVRDPDQLRQYEIPVDLPAGDYQVLGFMDIDDNKDPDAPKPDTGDPVFIPVGGYTLECPLQGVVVELAITLPESF